MRKRCGGLFLMMIIISEKNNFFTLPFPLANENRFSLLKFSRSPEIVHRVLKKLPRKSGGMASSLASFLFALSRGVYSFDPPLASQKRKSRLPRSASSGHGCLRNPLLHLFLESLPVFTPFFWGGDAPPPPQISKRKLFTWFLQRFPKPGGKQAAARFGFFPLFSLYVICVGVSIGTRLTRKGKSKWIRESVVLDDDGLGEKPFFFLIPLLVILILIRTSRIYPSIYVGQATPPPFPPSLPRSRRLSSFHF